MIDKIEELCVCDNCGNESLIEGDLTSQYNFCNFDCYDVFMWRYPDEITPVDTIFIKGGEA